MEAPGRAVRISAAMCAAGRSLADPRLSPDGATVAFVTASAAGAAVVLVPSGGGPETVLPGPAPARRGGLDWLPAGDGIVLAGADGRLWNQPVDGGPAVSLCEAHGAAAPAVSPDGAEVACTFDGRHVALVSTDESGPWPRRLSSHPDFCVDPAWSPDGAAVAWHEWDVPAMAWDDSRIAWAAARPVVSGGSSGGSSDRSAASGGDVGVVPTPLPAAVAQPRFAVDGTLGFLCDATGWLTLWSGRPGGPVGPR